MRCGLVIFGVCDGAGLRVQPVVMPFGDPQSWTLVDQDSAVVEPVEGFLAHLHAVERSPNTVKAYAHDLRDWFEFLDQRGVVWSRVRLEDMGRFVAWLRLPAGRGPAMWRVADGGERVLGGDGEPEAVGDLGVLRVPSAPRRGSGGSADDLAAAQDAWWVVATVVGALGVSSQNVARRIRMRAERRIADTLEAEQTRRSWRLVIGCGIGSCFPCWLRRGCGSVRHWGCGTATSTPRLGW